MKKMISCIDDPMVHIMRHAKGDRWLMASVCVSWAKVARQLQPECGVGPSWTSIASSADRMLYAMQFNITSPHRLFLQSLHTGSIPMLRAAMLCGVNLDVLDIDIAAGLGHTDMVFYMHDACNVKWDEDTLMSTAKNNKADTCLKLMARGCPCSSLSTSSAAIRGHHETLRILLEMGCPFVKTILCICVFEDQLECLKVALEFREIDLHDGLFFNACVRGYVEIAQFLANLGGCTFPLEVEVLNSMELDFEIHEILNSIVF